jgi:hypothetical protein
MKSKFKFSVLFVAFLFLFTTSGIAQFSRTDAINLVLNTILSTDVGKVNVYVSDQSSANAVTLIDNDAVSNPYPDSWVFFVDDNPLASWYHNSRIIFVSAANGAYTINQVQIYPKNLSDGYEAISSVSKPAPVALAGTAFVMAPETVPGDHNYALIVAAQDNTRNWYNTSLIYNVLIQKYNYNKENIIVLYSWNGESSLPEGEDLDGDENHDDIDGPATWANIQSTITGLVNDLGHQHQLAVFFTGIPVDNSGSEPEMLFHIDQNNFGSYPVSDLSEPMEAFDCAQMILFFDVNSSADVAWYFEAANGSNVLCQNRYIIGATDSNEPSLEEIYFSGGIYSEHLFYWASAVRGFLPDPELPWQVINVAIGSENLGGFPYATYIPNHPGDDVLDLSDDTFIQMAEAFEYANKMNTWSDDGYCYIPYISGVANSPINVNEIPFVEDLLTLSGLSGKIYNTQNVQGNFISYVSLELDNNVNLTFSGNSNLFINGNLYVNHSNSFLSFIENSNVKAGWGSQISILYGSLFAEDAGFISNDEYQLTININNGQNLILDDVTMEKCIVSAQATNNMSIENSNVSDSRISGASVNKVLIKDCEFINSAMSSDIYDQPQIQPSQFEVIRSNFTGIYSTSYAYAIKVFNYKHVYISKNTFDNNQHSVQLFDCGNAQNVCRISENIFYFNYIAGLTLSNTIADLTMNTFEINKTGLNLLNRTSAAIYGNSNANTPENTQYFKENELQAIYISKSSFHNFRYNAFEGNPYDDELYIFQTGNWPQNYFDVKYNYWGSVFKPEIQLVPEGSYIYVPMWNLYGEGDEADAEIMYSSANSLIDDENYEGAKIVLKNIVALYPNSPYSHASLKRLFSIEQYSGNNFAALQNYLRTDIVIQNNIELKKAAEKIANQCDIEMKNWLNAINWFESVIQNPEDIEDSIFAIIDLGHTYLLIDGNGYKSSNYIGKLPEYYPSSIDVHNTHTQYLLSLLPTNSKSHPLSESLENLEVGALMQNIPNPFKGASQLWYKVDEASVVALHVYDNIGRKVRTINCGEQTEGAHFVEFTSEGLPPGVYFYTLEINGRVTDSKKMTVMQ